MHAEAVERVSRRGGWLSWLCRWADFSAIKGRAKGNHLWIGESSWWCGGAQRRQVFARAQKLRIGLGGVGADDAQRFGAVHQQVRFAL